MPGALLDFGWPGLALLIWVGLSLGSFLNVVIYRLPVMIQKDWRASAREILEMPAEEVGEPFDLARRGFETEHRS